MMSHVCRLSPAWLASLLLAGMPLHEAGMPLHEAGMPLHQAGVRGASPASDKGAFRALAVKDDLSLTKKRGKPQEASAKAKPAKALEKAAQPAAPAANKPDSKKPAADNAAALSVLQGKRGAKKIEPIRLERKEGDDIDVAWNDYFAAHTGEQAPSQGSIRETVRVLMKGRKFDDAIGCIFAALRHEQGQPWMYEVLCLAMQLDERKPEEIERVLLSVLDFASTPFEVMYLAQYMARTGLEARALQLVRQVSQTFPWAPEPYVLGLRLAEKLDDMDAIQWATLGILSQPWSDRQTDVWDTGQRMALATLERLKSENRKQEADDYKKAVDQALRRDVAVVVSWTGEADIDLLVEEPAGSVCSFRNPRTLSGGIMLGDEVSRSKKDERKAQGAHEAYVCPKAFDGQYRVVARRVWGKVTADKITVEVFWHYGSKNERSLRKQIELNGDEAICVVNLEGGRRTEPLEQQQVANAVANTMANQFRLGLQVSQQLNALNDYGAAGSMARSRANDAGEGLNPPNPFLLRGSAGYMPSITTLPEGAAMFTSAVVSADRRYVRVSPLPAFMAITQVNTFNFVSGSTGSSSGGGQGGFGGGGKF